MTPIDKVKAARSYYLREARESFPRLSAIRDIQRNNVGDLTPELAQEKREIEDQMYRAGMEAFQEWAASLGWQPVKYEDVRKVIDEHRKV